MKCKKWLWLLFALLILGCTSPDTEQPQWDAITYSRTGGIAGFDLHMTISSDGSYQTVDRGQKAASGRLHNADRKALQELVAAVKWPELDPKYIDPRVADALFEGIALQMPPEGYTTLVGTGGAPPEALQNLLKMLRQILTGRNAT